GVLPNPHVLAQRRVIDAGDVRCPWDVRELAVSSNEDHVKNPKAVGIEPAKPVLILDSRHKQALETARRQLLADPRLPRPEPVLGEVDVRLGRSARSFHGLARRLSARSQCSLLGSGYGR